MAEPDLTTHYNYAEFTRAAVNRILRWDQSPPVGQPAPDFPLWTLGGEETSLCAVWRGHTYTVVEFGSFT
jgi:hypothetical protein